MARSKAKTGLTSLSNVEHDGVQAFTFGEEFSEAEGVKRVGADAMNTLYDTGVIVESALLPDNWQDRPEGNSDVVGFRTDVAELAAQNQQQAQKEAAGEATEI